MVFAFNFQTLITPRVFKDTTLCTWDCNVNTLRVRSALGKEMGLRLMPGCRWLERSMGIL